MEGCENGWMFYKYFCYQLNFDFYGILIYGEVIVVCMVKGVDLISVWGKKERDFIVQGFFSVSQCLLYGIDIFGV